MSSTPERPTQADPRPPEAEPAGGTPPGPGSGAEQEARSAPRPFDPAPPPPRPNRLAFRARDMIGAMVVLLLIVAVAGGMKSCSFSPGGPSVDVSSAPTVDAPARLAEFAQASRFPLRVPAVPEGWKSNSTDRGPVAGGGTAVRVGYLTPQGRYLRLVQSDATEENVVATENGGQLAGTGVIAAAGLQWVTYQAPGGEPFRVTTSPEGQRWLITGSGSDADFTALAQATVNGRLLPAGGGQN
ncbi:DUF4245 domain-containing protein [Pseudonocardia ailaonensis]|uniref:DUF4245 domain-containing protein n=1 Tax=Pseudonocardia ailaonensis TaxID=367279 RepID=A0ABN2MWY6_9PSEU